jgi:ribonuclease Z
LAAPAKLPQPDDKKNFAEKAGLAMESTSYSDFTKSGYWDVDDTLRPIYEEASKKLGREFPYPERKK